MIDEWNLGPLPKPRWWTRIPPISWYIRYKLWRMKREGKIVALTPRDRDVLLAVEMERFARTMATMHAASYRDWDWYWRTLPRPEFAPYMEMFRRAALWNTPPFERRDFHVEPEVAEAFGILMREREPEPDTEFPLPCGCVVERETRNWYSFTEYCSEHAAIFAAVERRFEEYERRMPP